MMNANVEMVNVFKNGLFMSLKYPDRLVVKNNKTDTINIGTKCSVLVPEHSQVAKNICRNSKILAT